MISTVLSNNLQDGKKLKPADLDQMEKDIFTRLSNLNQNIALDQFHSRLVTNAHIKRTGLDKFGVPIESNDNSFQGPEEAVANRLNSSHVQRA